MLATNVSRQTITQADFKALIACRAEGLIRTAGYLRLHGQADSPVMTRPLLGELLLHSTQLEELLDAYGASNNRRWRHFRACMAAIKRFSGAAYELLHIQHACEAYRLLEIDEDFIAAADGAMAFTSDVILTAAERVLQEAEKLGLPGPERIPPPGTYDESLPPGKLPNDLAARKAASVRETVTHLATAFLALAAESELLHVVARTDEADYASCVPNPVHEGALRQIRHQFHNMQSQYDTFVSETKAEGLDADLPVLRGHISIVFHLLRVATAFAHYYERHINGRSARSRGQRQALVDPKRLLGTLMRFAITFASHYLAAGQDLCQAMLKRYAKVGRVSLPVPRYRGFHVRPSTLVAKIVLHYGSEVRMILEGQEYDASSPLEIFRANEKINAQKRRWLAMEIGRLSPVNGQSAGTDLRATAEEILRTLARQDRLVIYEQPLQWPDEPVRCDGTMLQRIVEEVARLQAVGKIDIHADLNIQFVGDSRVLDDIKLLADNGYGEDNSGNNIPLPKKLTYLRRKI